MQVHRQGGQYQACIDSAQALQGRSSSQARLRVGQVAGMDVVNEKGEQVGNVERLARGGDQRIFVLMTYRGPRWPGNKRVAIPLDDMTMHAGKLLLPGIGEKDILAMPAVPPDGGAYQNLDQAATVSLPQLEASPSQTGAIRQ
ncbi:PRC-barrel domain-containing protein [Microvirga arabica]|uniref:PRC-barrel domain-containing protein n=1 Tax=Microvirga arabica TaxID=1128671 RepID=A0ABV6YBM9_9HYPH